jgi:hypothetical protein
VPGSAAKFTLGADVSLALGIATGARRFQHDRNVLTYSPAKGLYMNLAGGVLKSDDGANGDVYGRGASLGGILAERGLLAPTEAHGFLAELSNQPAAPGVAVQWRSAPSARSPESVPAVPAVADNNLRARVVEMQQNLDRLLADTTPRPVGMSGTIGRAQQDTVPIDRARLEQIRLQLSAILAALNRP